MTRLPALSVLFLVVVWLLLLPSMAAQPSGGDAVLYGVTVLVDDAAVRVPEEAWVCVRDAQGTNDVTVRHSFDDGEELLLFLHDEAAASCQTVEGAGLLSLASGERVRVLVLPNDPTERYGPGVVQLAAPGASILVRDVGDDAIVGVLADSVGTRTQIVDWDTLEVLAETTDAEEVSLHGARDGIAGRDVVVVVRDIVVESSVLVRWEDPDWFARQPSIGVVAAVAAAALFLVLFKGRPRRAG